jgi:hypothetical protein
MVVLRLRPQLSRSAVRVVSATVSALPGDARLERKERL